MHRWSMAGRATIISMHLRTIGPGISTDPYPAARSRLRPAVAVRSRILIGARTTTFAIDTRALELPFASTLVRHHSSPRNNSTSTSMYPAMPVPVRHGVDVQIALLHSLEMQGSTSGMPEGASRSAMPDGRVESGAPKRRAPETNGLRRISANILIRTSHAGTLAIARRALCRESRRDHSFQASVPRKL